MKKQGPAFGLGPSPQRALQDLGQQMVADLKQVTQTWQEHDPQFEVQITPSIGLTSIDEEMTVSTDDQVFWWLNKGTKSRAAHMTSKFKPKTSVGWLGSRQGEGGVLKDKKGRKVLTRSKELPGIEARNWDEALMEKYRNTPSVSTGIFNSLVKFVLGLMGKG